MGTFYSLKNILAKNATYNMIIGERSNGKTYSVLKYGLEKYIKSGEQLALVRRFADDFIGKRGQVMFAALVDNGEVKKLTKGKYTDIFYQASKWYLCRYEDDKRICDNVPFAYGFAITAMEHDKSTSYPKITTIVFDEFITRLGYVTDEFILFTNIISTIVRQRDDVKIFMLGNTVNKYCPYFKEMGITHITKMKQGAIDIYRYGDSRLTVAVEYTHPTARGKKSDFYFAFDNPKLQMITGGAWELEIYPHIKERVKPNDILFQFFVMFNDEILHCEVIGKDSELFINVHPKNGDIKYKDTDLIYSTEYNPRANYKRKILKPTSAIEKKIAMLFVKEKVFYSDNETGEIMRNYLLWCNDKG